MKVCSPPRVFLVNARNYKSKNVHVHEIESPQGELFFITKGLFLKNLQKRKKAIIKTEDGICCYTIITPGNCRENLFPNV